MALHNQIRYLWVIALCLSENQIVGSSYNDNNGVDTFTDYINNQLFINDSKEMSINDIVAPFFDDSTYQTTNGVLETNDIYQYDALGTGIKSFNKFYKHLNSGISPADVLLLEKTLNNVEKSLAQGRKKKYKQLTKQAISLGSPFQGCSKDPAPSSGSTTIKKYEVDLDADPEDRWKEVVQQNSAQIKKLADFFEEKLGPMVMSVIDSTLTRLHHSLPPEYCRELSGLSKVSGISVARVTLYNVFYEFFTFCTSIVMEAEDGKMYHGRNLDFGIFMGWDAKNHTWLLAEILRPLIIKVDFIRNGKPLYSAVTYAGYTGILTGVKKDRFSLTIDERFMLDGGYVGLAEWVLGVRDSSWLGLLTRRVMESAATYDQAQQWLVRTPLVAPVYFILAGNASQQGSIVTRGRRDADIWRLGNKHKQQRGSWFLVQTNYDHWKRTPFFDQRRQYAVQCMDEIGRDNPKETLYRVLSTRPVLNKETTLTAVMDVREGSLEVWERDCQDPCWPF